MSKKIITVFGATGAQGGGLARAILNDPNSEFSVRAVTRDSSSEKAKALAALGAEIVIANIDDPLSMERSLDGAYGAYFVTFYWSHLSPERELAETSAMAESARVAKLEHVIWSTLEDTRQFYSPNDESVPTLMGKYKVPHFDAKGEADKFFTDLEVPTTFMLASFYWENLIYFGMGPKRDNDGILYLNIPMGDKKLSGIAAEDIGKCAYGIFKRGKKLIGQRIGIAGDEPSGEQMAASLTRALGETVKYRPVTPAQFRSFGFPGADDLGNMFQFYQDNESDCMRIRNVENSKILNPELQSFDKWLDENAQKIPF
jgi:uncharacterized protein YbjT (DUF2867 family)